MTELVFKEKQKFRELAFFILIILIQLLFLTGLVVQVIFGIPWGTRPASDIVLLFTNLIPASVLLLFIIATLRTEMDEKSVRFQFFPFHFKDRLINHSEIENIRCVKYNGIRDYLGWGLRYSAKKGWCYTVSGSYGIHICLKNGKKILIGTHKEKEVSEFLMLLKERKV